jgi:RNA polymerase sigma-70 factor (ECF subfamily)
MGVGHMIQLQQSETELIQAAQAGCAEAFAALVARHQQAVRACLAVRLHDPHEADDLAQEVFLTAFNRLSDFDPERPFGPWLRGIAFNLLRNHWRKFRPCAIGGNEELAALVDQQIALECDTARESVLLGALRDCLERLEGSSRELLRLRYGEETTVRELAQRFGRGYSAVTMQLHRLRELLTRCVAERCPSVHKEV